MWHARRLGARCAGLRFSEPHTVTLAVYGAVSTRTAEWGGAGSSFWL